MVSASECVGTDLQRLLVMSLNGWPIGLMLQALLGYATQHWLWYHISLAIIAALMIPLICLFVDESARWLTQHQHIDRAHRVLTEMARVRESKFFVIHKLFPKLSVRLSGSLSDRRYTYLDLFTSGDFCPCSLCTTIAGSTLLIHLLATTYSWLSSSIVSFAVYELITGLPGDRYLNTFILALFKQATGLIPLMVSRCCGRRPVLLTAVAVTWFSVAAAVVLFLVTGTQAKGSWLLTTFALLGASAIDPIWKINHLYSVELFPTVVRNMARAVCNLGSRVGSTIAPQVVFLSVYSSVVPYIIFTILVTAQFVVSTVCLPETRGRPLPDSLESQPFSSTVNNSPSKKIHSECTA